MSNNENLGKLGATYCHGTAFAQNQCEYQKEAIYGNGEPKNVMLVLVQKAHFSVRACKVPGFMHRRIGPSVQICGNSGLPFAEVPCLHQCNLYIKR